MGQQQLLPLLLAAIVVGTAIILGMDMFAQENRTAGQNEIHLRLVEVAGRAQEWYHRPRTLGGGNRSFAGISWQALNMQQNTDHAIYAMASMQIDNFVLTATSTSDGTMSISYKVYADSLILQ